MEFHKSIIARLLLFIIAFQVLNLSIDAPGAQMASFTTGHDKFNYIDSYIEFVAEIILKYDNIIPESKHRQQKEIQQHKQFQVICVIAQPLTIKTFTEVPAVFYIAYTDKYFYQFFKEIKPPPKLI